jgi:ferredoxin
MSLLVTVDAERCQGHARCYAACPEVFDVDEQGNAVVITPVVPAGREQEVREAAANCPEAAIKVNDAS